MMYQNKRLVLAAVTGIQDKCVTYPSCNQCCSKLLVDPVSQRYHCMKCNISCHGNKVLWRYRLVVTVADNSAIGNVVVFGRTLDPLFGKTATDFHRSLTDLEKSGYPAESLLLEALLHTFHGKYFYFGFKLGGTDISQSTTLKDILKSNSEESQILSQFENDFETSHILAYQILPNSSSELATVTDHMRQSVYLLKHGYNSVSSVCQRKAASKLSKSCPSQNTSSSTCINSYIDNSKQESVVFSFEESGVSSRFDRTDHSKDLYRKDSQTHRLCRKSSSYHTATSNNNHLSGSFPNLKGTCTSVSRLADDQENLEDEIIGTFTNEIIKQLEYSTAESQVPNTSNRIDRELREREIRRKVRSLSRDILLRQQSWLNSQREQSQRTQNHSLKQFDVPETIFDFKYQKNTKASTNLEENEVTKSNTFYTCCQADALHNSKDCHSNSGMKHNLGHSQEKSESLSAFLESQLILEERQNGVLCRSSYNSPDSFLNCRKKDNDVNKKDGLMSSKSEKLHTTKVKVGNVKKVGDGINDVIMPDSEGLETFFETQFTDGIMNLSTEENADDDSKKYTSLTRQDSKLPLVANVYPQKKASELTLQLSEAVRFSDLPESEDLEAFLCSFDDSIKDSGLYLDNTTMSAENKLRDNFNVSVNKEKESEAPGNTVALEIFSNVKIVLDDKKLNQSSNNQQSRKALDNLQETCYIPEKYLKPDLTDNELDSFLANISENIIHKEQTIKPSDIIPENSEGPKSNIQSATGNSDFSKSEARLQRHDANYQLYPAKVHQRKNLDLVNIRTSESLDLEEYLDAINTSNNSKMQTVNVVDRHTLRQEKEGNIINIKPAVETDQNQSQDGGEIDPKLLDISGPSATHKKDFEEKDRDISLAEDIDTIDNGGKCLVRLNSSSNSVLPENSFLDKVCDTEDLHNELDCALINLNNSSFVDNLLSQSLFENEEMYSNIETPFVLLHSKDKITVNSVVNKNNAKGTSPIFVLENTSFDLFEDTCSSPNLPGNPIHILVGESDTEETSNNNPKDDDSIIFDSPNTLVEDNHSRVDSCFFLCTSKLAVKERESEAAKNVQFDRQLQRVSSCQLMDIKMKLNESPHRKAKVRRKSILKSKQKSEVEPNPTCSTNDLNKFKRPILDVLEEKSHLTLTEIKTLDTDNFESVLCGSQDLFADTETPAGKITVIDSNTKTIGDILIEQTEAKSITTNENLQANSIHARDKENEINTLTQQPKEFKNAVDDSKCCLSQDMFSESPPVNHIGLANTCRNVRLADKNQDKNPDFSDTTVSMLALKSRGNYNKDKENTLPNRDKTNIFQDCVSVANNSKLNGCTPNIRTHNWLKSALLNITNTPNTSELNKEESNLKQRKVSLRRQQLIISDSPVTNVCQDDISTSSSVIKELALENKNIDKKIVNVTDKKVALMSNPAQSSNSLNLGTCLDRSPDLFSDSPACSVEKADVVCQYKSPDKLSSVVLCKKLFS